MAAKIVHYRTADGSCEDAVLREMWPSQSGELELVSTKKVLRRIQREAKNRIRRERWHPVQEHREWLPFSEQKHKETAVSLGAAYDLLIDIADRHRQEMKHV
jgi:hypothetical protein